MSKLCKCTWYADRVDLHPDCRIHRHLYDLSAKKSSSSTLSGFTSIEGITSTSTSAANTSVTLTSGINADLLHTHTSTNTPSCLMTITGGTISPESKRKLQTFWKEKTMHHEDHEEEKFVTIKNGILQIAKGRPKQKPKPTAELKKAQQKELISGLGRFDAAGIQEMGSSFPSLPMTLFLLSTIGLAGYGAVWGAYQGTQDGILFSILAGVMVSALTLVLIGLGAVRRTKDGVTRTKCIQEIIKYFNRVSDSVDEEDFYAVGHHNNIAVEIPNDAPTPVCPTHGTAWKFGNFYVVEGHAVIKNASKVWARCPKCQPQSTEAKEKNPDSPSVEYDF